MFITGENFEKVFPPFSTLLGKVDQVKFVLLVGLPFVE
jgi:hypothetical protein